MFTPTDGTNTTYTFTLPKIKFTGGNRRSAAREISINAVPGRFTPRIAPRKSLSSGCLPDEII